MTPERRKHNSRKMKLRWMKARKYAVILGKPKEEVWNNLDLCVENSKGLLSGRPDIIALVLKGGKWKVPLDEKAYWENVKKKWEEEDAKVKDSHMPQDEDFEKEDAEIIAYNAEVDKHNAEVDQEKFQKEKAEACGYTYKYKPRETHIEPDIKSAEEIIKEYPKAYINAQNVEVKTNGKMDDPFSGLKIAMWYITKVGSIEKAEKLLQAAKLSIEAAKS